MKIKKAAHCGCLLVTVILKLSIIRICGECVRSPVECAQVKEMFTNGGEMGPECEQQSQQCPETASPAGRGGPLRSFKARLWRTLFRWERAPTVS